MSNIMMIVLTNGTLFPVMFSGCDSRTASQRFGLVRLLGQQDPTESMCSSENKTRNRALVDKLGKSKLQRYANTYTICAML